MSEESWNKLTAEEQAKLLGEAGSKVDQSLPEDQQMDQLAALTGLPRQMFEVIPPR